MEFAPQDKLRIKLREILSPTIASLGFWLSAVEMDSDKRGLIVRLFVDAEGGVTIADCAKVSREVSTVLDVEDPIASPYNLEVSSPGTDRLIERDEDFERFAGFRVRVRMAPGESRRRYSGVLIGLEEGDVLLQSEVEVHRIPRDAIATVRLNPTSEEFERLRAMAQKSRGETP